MFRHVGLGEQAGSGIPKIYRNWKRQNWLAPLLRENDRQDQTLLELRMVNLLPDTVIEELDRRFPGRYLALPEVERLALAVALIEDEVNHARLMTITDSHPHDVSKSLSNLVKEGLFEAEGTGRGKRYFLPGKRPAIGDEPFEEHAFQATFTDDAQAQANSEHLAERSEHLLKDSEHLERVRSITMEMQAKKRVPKAVMTKAILDICVEFTSLRDLSQILSRTSDSLRVHYLNKLVAERRLELRYPDKPNHPSQRYRTKTDSSTE